MSVIIHVSPHVLADAASCDTKAWTRHVKGYTSRGDAIKAVAGQAFHAAIAALFDPKHGDWSAQPQQRAFLAVETFHRIYDPVHARLAADKLEQAYTPTNLRRILARWIEMHPPSLLPWKRVLMVEEAWVSRMWRVSSTGAHLQEVPIALALAQPPTDDYTYVKLIVRPDLVVERLDGKIGFVDTKTTGWHITDEGWRTELRLSSQVQLYADAVVQKFGADAIYGGHISAMELRTLPGAEPATPKLKKDGTPAKIRTCAEHGVPYIECGSEHAKAEFIECLTTPERVAQAVRDAQQDAARMVQLHAITNPEHLNMRGGATGKCRFCPATGWCEASRPFVVENPAATLDSYFLYEPWAVEEGRRE